MDSRTATYVPGEGGDAAWCPVQNICYLIFEPEEQGERRKKCWYGKLECTQCKKEISEQLRFYLGAINDSLEKMEKK